MTAIPKKAVKLSKAKFRKLKKQAHERDKYTCQLCNTAFRQSHATTWLHPHHIIPCGRIHLDVLENILTIDTQCHRLLHDGLLKISVDDLIEKYRARLGDLADWNQFGKNYTPRQVAKHLRKTGDRIIL